MSSKVVLQALDSRTFKLALKDVRFTRFNEKLTGLEPENWRFMHTPEPEETTSEYKTVLESPVEFTMVEGEVKEIKSSEEEATWTINFKKSLISLIKIQSPSGRIDISQNNVRTETGRLPEIWSVMEEGVDGECENTYQFIEVPTYMLSELTHGKMGMETCEERGLKAYQITKTRNVAKCTKRSSWMSVVPDEGRESIMIIGTVESVAKAKEVLEERIKELDNIVEDSMTVDPKHHKHFVARRGLVLRTIGDEFGGVVVSFPRAGVTSDKVNLKGARNCVDAAKLRIQEIVQDLEEMVTIDCEIEQQFHRAVMGAKGSQVQRITRDFDVQIKFPDKASENGEALPPNPERSSDPNIIRITGKKNNCDGAANALKELVPITAEVVIPFEFHRYIIGQKGKEVREMMNEYDVNIRVPTADQQSDIVLVSGVPTHVENAKAGLAEKLEKLELENLERIKRSFEVTVEINFEYHPKIIGRSGGVINKLRQDFKVNIQLSPKGSENEELITITGLEEDANAAKQAILKIVNQYESQIKEEVQIDPRVHSMIIGKRGRTIRKIMDDFKVDIRLPRDGDEDASLVVITGDEEAVLDCIDHLKLLEEA